MYNNNNNNPNSKRVAAVKKTLKKKLINMQENYPKMPLFSALIGKINESSINDQLSSFKMLYKSFGVPHEYFNAFNTAVNNSLINQNDENNNNNNNDNNNNSVLDVSYERVKPTIGGPKSQLTTYLPKTVFRRSTDRSVGGKRKTYRKRRQRK